MTKRSSLPKLPEFDAVILDLDGLVIDSEPTYRAAWKEAGELLGFPLTETLLRSFSGKSYDLIEGILKSEFGHDFPMQHFRDKAVLRWRESVEATGIPVKPGLRTLLAVFEELSIPFCLATNSEKRYAEKCLSHAGLAQAFPTRITRDQVKSPKPAPDIFLAAALRLNVEPERCIVLEDSETGALAALAAKTQLILVTEPGAVTESVTQRAFARLESLEQFIPLIG